MGKDELKTFIKLKYVLDGSSDSIIQGLPTVVLDRLNSRIFRNGIDEDFNNTRLIEYFRSPDSFNNLILEELIEYEIRRISSEEESNNGYKRIIKESN